MWNFCRGFSSDWSRHKIDLIITRKARGLNTKQGVFFLLWTGTYRKGHGLQELLGVSNRRGSRQLGAWGDAKLREEFEGITMMCLPARKTEGGGQISKVNRRRIASSPARAGHVASGWLQGGGGAASCRARRVL
jgi:hypothetical protein